MGFVKVKKAGTEGPILAGVEDPTDPSWVTVFPANHKDDENLQGPAVPVQVGDGQAYEVVA